MRRIHMLHRLVVFFLSLLPFVGHAQNVVLRSGGAYRIECASIGQGGVVPGSVVGNSAVLLHVTDVADSADFLWTIAENGTTADGTKAYTLRHTSTGLYATYDGLRDDNKRYVALTPDLQGDASRWIIVDRFGTWSIENVQAPAHHWHTRSSNLCGTYADDVPPGGGSRYSLYTSEGSKVTHLEHPKPEFSNLIGDFRFDGVRAIYDKSTHTYLASLPEAMRQERSIRLRVDYDASQGELEVDYITAAAGRQHTFSEHLGGHVHQLALRTPDGSVYEARLAFTFLPVVELFGSFGASASRGQVRVNDADNPDDELLNMRAHWRGNTSLNRPKKSYAVKLVDASGQSIDRKFLGLRSDNNWILDAAFVDPSRIRNRVSTDIWNDFRTDPYYGDQEKKARTATRGKMVEVFLNGSYDGVYCMTEKLDRKQLKLKKFSTVDGDGSPLAAPPQHGIIYKAVEWHYTSYFGNDGGAFTGVMPAEPVNSHDAWGGWEIKYPDFGDGDPIDWGPLYNHVAFMATCSDDAFMTEVAQRFDLPAMRDYYLLQELAMAYDNSAKNIYWFIYDAAESTQMSLAPWDFDGTWGRVWDGSKSYSVPDCTLRDKSGSLLSANKIYSYLMRLDYDGWNAQLASRYAELRRLGIFDPAHLRARFDAYLDLIEASGADSREVERWDGSSGYRLDWSAERDYLHEWIDAHVAYLDSFYGYDPIVSIAEAATSPDGARHQDVYDLQGRHVMRLSGHSAADSLHELRQLPAGIYVVGGRRVKISI